MMEETHPVLDPLDPGEETDSLEEEGIHGAILFSVGKEYFALPLEDVAEIHHLDRITPLPLAPDFLEGVINVHGILTSVVRPDIILGIEDAGEGQLLLRLIPEKGGVTLRVDAMLGMVRYSVLEEVTRGSGAGLGKPSFIEGVFRSGERLVSLMNPDKLRIWIDNSFGKGVD